MDNGFINFSNVFNNHIKDVYQKNLDFIKALTKLEFPNEDVPACRNCEYLLLCIFCFIRTFEVNKGLKEPCQWYKRNIEEGIIGQYIHL